MYLENYILQQGYHYSMEQHEMEWNVPVKILGIIFQNGTHIMCLKNNRCDLVACTHELLQV